MTLTLDNQNKLVAKSLTKKDGIYTAYGRYYLVINHRLHAFTERVLSGEGANHTFHIEAILNYNGFNVLVSRRLLKGAETNDLGARVAKEMLTALWKSFKK